MNDQRKRKQGATPRRRPLDWRRPLRRLAQALAGGLVLALLIGGGRWLLGLQLEWQPMALAQWSLQSPLVYQQREALDRRLQAYRGRSLLTLSPARIQDDLQELPWIAEVSVAKGWPDRLRIRVVEHQPVARWNGERVLNSDGEPLTRPVADLVLADLSGPSGQAGRVMEQYLRYSRVFAGTDFRLAGVRMHSRGAWDLRLDNDIRVALGSRDMLGRINRVVALLERSRLDLAGIDYIDARYPNGIAVGWRGDTEPSA